MRKIISKKITTVLASLLFATAFMAPMEAAKAPKEQLAEFIDSCPYIGLLTNKVSYGPITLKDFDLAESGRIVIAKPGEMIEGSVRYKVDADGLETLTLHHIIVGIKGENESQSCITHTLGIWDKKGSADFYLKAPSEKGLYEVRFDYHPALTCGQALQEWQENPPSSSSVVGFVIVE